MKKAEHRRIYTFELVLKKTLESPLDCKEIQPVHPKRNQLNTTNCFCSVVVVQLLSHVQLFATPQTAARQASLSFTIFQSLLKLMSIESVMPSNHLVLCCPLLLLPSIFPSIRVCSRVNSSHQVAKVLEL